MCSTKERKATQEDKTVGGMKDLCGLCLVLLSSPLTFNSLFLRGNDILCPNHMKLTFLTVYTRWACMWVYVLYAHQHHMYNSSEICQRGEAAEQCYVEG